MKFLLPILALAFASNSFADSSARSCLAQLKDHKIKFVSGDVKSILLECHLDKSCPFSVGDYDPKSGSIALPFNQKGKRGIVLYSGNESHFINFPVKKIKNDEIRQLGFQINQEYCGEFSRIFGVSQDGISETIHNGIAKTADYFDSKLIGYKFKFADKATCKMTKATPAYSLQTPETEQLINGAIKRDIDEKVYSTLQTLTKESANGESSLSSCGEKHFKHCVVSNKKRYEELDEILANCLAIAKSDNQLYDFIAGQRSRLKDRATEIGYIEAKSSKKKNSNLQKAIAQ